MLLGVYRAVQVVVCVPWIALQDVPTNSLNGPALFNDAAERPAVVVAVGLSDFYGELKAHKVSIQSVNDT